MAKYLVGILVLLSSVAFSADEDVFKMKVGEKMAPTRWQNGPRDPRAVNDLITTPCFEYSLETPYCMPGKDGEKGFVCSGQSAAMVAHLRSLGIRAVPFYLEWQNAKKETEAHAMVAVPFVNEKKQACHHILEVARSWPRQPVVEFACCTADLRACALEHFTNPPSAEKAAEKGAPARTPLDKELNEKKFDARTIDTNYDLKDPYNPGTPIWTLEKGKWACPGGLCVKHSVAPHITIDQTQVKPGDPSTFGKTVIGVDYSGQQKFACTQTCPKQNCILASTGAAAPLDMPVQWPPTKATCRAAAVLRANVVHPQFTCQSLCETPRASDGYRGGTYRLNVEEPAMRCVPDGPVVHRVRKPEDFRGPLPKDGSDLPRKDGEDHGVR